MWLLYYGIMAWTWKGTTHSVGAAKWWHKPPRLFWECLQASACNLVLQGASKGRRRCSHWYICVPCNQSIDRRERFNHFKSTKHTKRCRELGIAVPELTTPVLPMPCEVTAVDTEEYERDETSMLAGMELEDDVVMTPDDGIYGESTKLITVKEETMVRPIKVAVGEWMQTIFGSQSEPTRDAVLWAFKDHKMIGLYYIAEHVKEYGGIQYLITRAFRSTEHVHVPRKVSGPFNQVTISEAWWHWLNFTQYVST